MSRNQRGLTKLVLERLEQRHLLAGDVLIQASQHGAEQSGNAQLDVLLSAPSASDTVIAYGVTGSAVPGIDYALLNGVVTVPAGAISAALVVDVIDDVMIESSETVVITLTSILSGEPGTTIGSAASATVTILDNDSGIVSISATSNGNEPNSNGQFVVSMSAPSATPTVATYSTGGTATPDSDYRALGGTVTLAPGSTAVLLPVEILDDESIEGPEDVMVTLTSILFGDADIVIAPLAASATVQLVDNDPDGDQDAISDDGSCSLQPLSAHPPSRIH